MIENTDKSVSDISLKIKKASSSEQDHGKAEDSKSPD